jgi:hypothetical protein
MKRIILVAILLFPILSLVGWVIWGATRDKKLPSASDPGTNIPALITNTIGDQPNGSK